MAFSDPISVTVNGVAKSLPRIFSATGAPSTFKTADDEFVAEIAHQAVKGGRRERHVIKVTQRKIVADPFNPSTNLESKASVHIVLENPIMGFSDTELGYLAKALADFVNVAGNQTKFIGGEA